MKAIQFTKPWQVDLIEKDEMPEGSTLIETHYSIISAGTEMAILSGNEGWAELPYIPGYGSVGTVIKDEKNEFRENEMVFTYGTHTAISATDTVTLRLPENVKPEHAVFVRMAAVSITAIRCSNIELGDSVAVIGAGIVGNLAAQLAQLSGAQVTIVDPNKKRRAIAKECGIVSTYADIHQIPKTEKFLTVIDASGIPSVAISASEIVDEKGELILLGSPRGSYHTDVTPFLNKIHLCPVNMTVKGAHEWRYPVGKAESGMYKHSIERNIECLLKLIELERLHIEPLITDIVLPQDVSKLYQKFRDKDNESLGVIINWKEKQ